YRNYKDGQHTIPAFHIDYALYIEACLDLYSSSLDQQWLDLTVELTEVTMDHFYDQATDMFNYNGENSEVLITNNVETQDNVIPSSNSVMAHNLFRLGHMMLKREYLDLSASMMKQMQGRFEQYPHGFANWGRLFLMHLNPYYEIVVSGPSANSMVGSLKSDYLPHAMVVGSTGTTSLPLFQNRFESDLTRIYVCRDNVCQLPVENPEDAERIYMIK
ncbi:MAG: thioredoxin domain-containing protein, partial [Bacteroidota bacterium]|nr:thioredoxin domain-containing protein [Bacteroidota bacterium]